MTYHYSTSGASLPDALQELSAATHVPIACDAQLKGRVEGRFDMTPQRFVDTLARAYGLVWYYDGAVLHFDAANAQSTLVLRLNYAKAADLHTLLVQTSIDDMRFTARDDVPARGLILFRGPPAYIALVGRAAQRLDGDARARVATAVRIVPLRYSTAADRAAFGNGRSSVVSGVASRAARALDPHGDLHADVTEYEPPLPVISADPSTNSVLVRDRPARLDADVRAVTALDRPDALVAIDLLIADVSTDTLRALGFGAGADTPLVRRGTAQAVLASVRAAAGARKLADSELQTVDGVAVAWERRAERPVASVDMRAGRSSALVASAKSPASSTPDASTASDAPEAPDAQVVPSDANPRMQPADGALRIVPSVDARAASSTVMLAAEWRGEAIDVARATLAAGDALVMIEPVAARRAGSALARVIVLAPRVLDPRGS
jgi:type III secretion protein C